MIWWALGTRLGVLALESVGPSELQLCLGHSLCQLTEAPELGCSGPNAGKAGAKSVGLCICVTFHPAQLEGCCLRPLRVCVHMSAFCDWLLICVAVRVYMHICGVCVYLHLYLLGMQAEPGQC